MALLAGNPAIDRIPNPTSGLCPLTADQRGEPSVADEPCDAGAVQLGAITNIAFSRLGSATSSPTMTVTGRGFGSAPPTGYSATDTTCGTFSHNGDWYANSLVFNDLTEHWTAGEGTPTNRVNCIGTIAKSWSNTRVVLKFGNAYGFQSNWIVNRGDAISLDLNALSFQGVVPL